MTLLTLKHPTVNPVKKKQTMRMTVSRPTLPNVQFSSLLMLQIEVIRRSIDDNSCTLRGPTRSHTIVTASKFARPLDCRLMAVVNRYEAQGAAGESYTESNKNGDIASLAERLSRLPTTTDPCMWRVRVRVSL